MLFSKTTKRERLFFLSFFVLTFIIYGQSLTGDFVFDDRNIVEHKKLLSATDNLGQMALYPFFSVEAGLYRPVTLISYAVNFIFFGDSPTEFHLINLLLYIAICVLIYFLIKRLFHNEWLAFLASSIFLLLPIHTEVVANITGRSELLALFFSLLVLLELAHERVNFWRAGLWLLLAIGAKEAAIAAIPLALIILYQKEGKVDLEIAKKYFTSLSAIIVAASAYFFLRFFVLGPAHFLEVKTGLIENPLLFTDTLSRVATAFKILWMYVQKLFWPTELCSDYSYNQIPIIDNFFHTEVLLGLAVFFTAISAMFIFARRQPVISFAAGIFIFSFLPVSNMLFPTGTIAGERLFFFPSLGFALIAALGLYNLFYVSTNKAFRITLVALIFLSLSAYGILAFHRQAVWTNEESLFLSAAKCAPNSVLSRSNAGAIYLLAGDLKRAQEELELARSIKPTYSKGLNNLGLVYWKKGENRKAEQLYREALSQEFPYPGVFQNLVLLHLSEGNDEKAMRWLKFLKLQ